MIPPSLDALSPAYRLILCDLWGCVHDGMTPFPGVVERLARWRDEGRIVVFLTNAPRPDGAVRDQLDRLGIGRDLYGAVATSGDTGIEHVKARHGDEVIGFIGPRRDWLALEAVGLNLTSPENANTLICCGFDDDRLNDLHAYGDILEDAVERGAHMLCLNPDKFVVRGGRRELCAGAIAEEFSRLGGRVTSFGKPYAPLYGRAIRIGSDLSGQKLEFGQILAIGDNLETDLQGAANFGLNFVLVANGVSERLAPPDASRICRNLSARPGFELIQTVKSLG